jgi:outer membrane protein assembly factor BamB
MMFHRLGSLAGLSILPMLLNMPMSPLRAQTAWTTRSFDSARTSANLAETTLTPAKVGNNLMIKRTSLKFDDDPRLEAQPLYVPNLTMSDGKTHDVAYVCTMANHVWAFDSSTGKPIWAQPRALGRPIKPKSTPFPGFPSSSEIDLWGINILWGVLSTPVIDLETKTLYVLYWTSADGTVAQAVFKLAALNLADGTDVHPPLLIQATAADQGVPGAQFIPSRQKQRPGLLLTTAKGGGGTPKKTLFVAFSTSHEEGDNTHGWVIAFDTASFQQTAAWCSSPKGAASGIWQAAQGPAADENGDLYLMTGNYGVRDANGNTKAPADGDLPDSFVKLTYTPPGGSSAQGKLEAVAWFTPFRDSVRNKNGDDDFQDYDLGSGGPVPLPGMNLVVGAGKDGVLYVLPKDTTAFGKGADFSKLKAPPIFFTYFPGFGIDASKVQNLDRLYDGKTHHLHGSPAFWNCPGQGPTLFVWGENESLRAWTVSTGGQTSFRAKSAEVASAGMGGKGGMPGGFPVISANGTKPNTGIVWATAPIHGDANRFVVPGILRAYDATNLDPVKNLDGTPRLKLLWDSTHIPGNTFNHSKFCAPIVADGKVFVPTYDGRVDVYGLAAPPAAPLTPSNADRVPEDLERGPKP